MKSMCIRIKQFCESQLMTTLPIYVEVLNLANTTIWNVVEIYKEPKKVYEQSKQVVEIVLEGLAGSITQEKN